MAMVLEIQVGQASPGLEADVLETIKTVLANRGLLPQTEEFTPADETLTELGSMPASKALVKVHQS